MSRQTTTFYRGSPQAQEYTVTRTIECTTHHFVITSGGVSSGLEIRPWRIISNTRHVGALAIAFWYSVVLAPGAPGTSRNDRARWFLVSAIITIITRNPGEQNDTVVKQQTHRYTIIRWKHNGGPRETALAHKDKADAKEVISARIRVQSRNTIRHIVYSVHARCYDRHEKNNAIKRRSDMNREIQSRGQSAAGKCENTVDPRPLKRLKQSEYRHGETLRYS